MYANEQIKDGVYLIQCGNLPYYKIGITRNLSKRINQMEIGVPLELKVISYFIIDNAYEVEQALHRKFFKLRKKREWFELEKKDVNFIKNALSVLGNKTESEKRHNY